ncbi:hypothetical protein QQ73_14875, partial [Candidatus Endoriftia persephone str. Guaymas]|nr:hypothetical protein [Candidatus Endoriftia persephone str. Guaymas]
MPAHDERDHAFARKYGIPIKQVIHPADGSQVDIQAAAYTDKGVLKDSGPFNDLTSEAAFDAIAEWLQARDKGEKTKNFRLRDWGVSRQRYWGTPIPMIHCEKCGIVPVPLEDLPVVLPEDIVYDENTINPINRLVAQLVEAVDDGHAGGDHRVELLSVEVVERLLQRLVQLAAGIFLCISQHEIGVIGRFSVQRL